MKKSKRPSRQSLFASDSDSETTEIKEERKGLFEHDDNYDEITVQETINVHKKNATIINDDESTNDIYHDKTKQDMIKEQASRNENEWKIEKQKLVDKISRRDISLEKIKKQWKILKVENAEREEKLEKQIEKLFMEKVEMERENRALKDVQENLKSVEAQLQEALDQLRNNEEEGDVKEGAGIDAGEDVEEEEHEELKLKGSSLFSKLSSKFKRQSSPRINAKYEEDSTVHQASDATSETKETESTTRVDRRVRSSTIESPQPSPISSPRPPPMSSPRPPPACPPPSRGSPQRPFSPLSYMKQDEESESSDDSVLGSSDSNEDETPPRPPNDPPPLPTSETVESKFSHMNDYFAARRHEQLQKEAKVEKRARVEKKRQETYEQEWDALAQAEKTRKAALHKQRRRRPPSKSGRISRRQHIQRRGEMGKSRSTSETIPEPDRKSSSVSTPTEAKTKSSTREELESSSDDHNSISSNEAENTHLPSEPSEAEAELFRRQQVRLKELYESEQLKRQEAEEADLVGGEVHRKIQNWSTGKNLMELLVSVQEFTTVPGLENATLEKESTFSEIKKAYRSIIRTIHPDKLWNVTVEQKLSCHELFSLLTQEYDTFQEGQ